MRDSAAQSEARALTHTYAIRARKEATAPDIIAVSEKKLPVEPTDYDIQVTNPLGQNEFDVILGMNWLTKHDAVENCKEKWIDLKCETGEVISVESGNTKDNVRIISAFSAQWLMRKGNEAFLAYILDTRDSKSKLEQLLVINEFTDVFFEELLGLQPNRKVEFVTYVVLETVPISVTRYLTAPAKLKDLKTQLQELLDKGFIRPSMSP
ncbi:uncharacterized protein [Gossypium hirsutum]|uniref:Uncharacterized protein n=1 Tax=Gossypium hirsutum TaxID=3635 RepID=A0A1U8KPA2_GOSHI|nr:uncharacterized protein LOC107919291 [Gossypium hirsutum]